MERTIKKPINAQVADLTDEDLELISELRKKVKEQEQRERYIKGLYFISKADDDYTEEEKLLVEGTACALGIGEEKYNELVSEVDSAKYPITVFVDRHDKEFNELLFEEMGTLTYLKGYQLSSEDNALKDVAKRMEIPNETVEKVLLDTYLKSQGVEDGWSTAAKVALGTGGILAGAAICAVTAGLAAPSIVGFVGSGLGLTTAATTSAGIAAGTGMATGATAVVASAGAVLGGGSSALALSVAENISNAHDKKQLKKVVKKQQKDEMTKVEITESLVEAIEVLKARLKLLEEKNASKRDIAAVQLQLANVQAQKAEIELGNEG